jgi:hypothetical protein
MWRFAPPYVSVLCVVIVESHIRFVSVCSFQWDDSVTVIGSLHT